MHVVTIYGLYTSPTNGVIIFLIAYEAIMKIENSIISNANGNSGCPQLLVQNHLQKVNGLDENLVREMVRM